MADQLITGTTLIEDRRSSVGEIWSCAGCHFDPVNPATDVHMKGLDAGANIYGAGIASGNDQVWVANVNLPNGVKVTRAIVWVFNGGTVATWSLRRRQLTATTATSEILATADENVEDTSILYDIIDNNTYAYFFHILDVDANVNINGARIVYE
jgi:hypothetical protein